MSEKVQSTGGFENYAPLSITYAEILELETASKLVVNRKYLITDFETVHTIVNTSDTNTGSVEPLIVTAVDVNKLSKLAVSTVYPQDIIHYTTDNSALTGATKGVIYYREDTITNDSAWYDWRVVLFRRWEDASGSGVFTVLTDNTFAFQDFLTGLNGDSSIGKPAAGQQLNNTIAISGFFYTKIGNLCQDNTFAADVTECNIGDECQNNTVLGSFTNNIITAIFTGNIFGINCSANTLHGLFQNNVIGNGFLLNFSNCDFSNNAGTWNDCRNNTFLNDFTNNDNIGNDFRYNLFQGRCNNINFAASTHVYADKTCRIYNSSGTTVRLVFESTTAPTYALVTA